MCEVDNNIQDLSGWDINAVSDHDSITNVDTLRPSRSISNYVTKLVGKSSCSSITDSDVTTIKDKLLTCRKYYDDFSWT